jgi:hypothetical protein
MGTALAASAILPGLELAFIDSRVATAVSDNYGFIPIKSLLTLIAPTCLGRRESIMDRPMLLSIASMPACFFCLAIWGMSNRAAVGLRAIFAGMRWYAVGPSGGLFLLIARLPGYASIRALSNGWFAAW